MWLVLWEVAAWPLETAKAMMPVSRARLSVKCAGVPATRAIVAVKRPGLAFSCAGLTVKEASLASMTVLFGSLTVECASMPTMFGSLAFNRTDMPVKQDRPAACWASLSANQAGKFVWLSLRVCVCFLWVEGVEALVDGVHQEVHVAACSGQKARSRLVDR